MAQFNEYPFEKLSWKIWISIQYHRKAKTETKRKDQTFIITLRSINGTDEQKRLNNEEGERNKNLGSWRNFKCRWSLRQRRTEGKRVWRVCGEVCGDAKWWEALYMAMSTYEYMVLDNWAIGWFLGDEHFSQWIMATFPRNIEKLNVIHLILGVKKKIRDTLVAGKSTISS